MRTDIGSQKKDRKSRTHEESGAQRGIASPGAGHSAPEALPQPGGRGFAAMAACYGMGVFNDNFFRQATLLLAVAAGVGWYQGAAMALFALPYLLLSAPAGWFADRHPKRRVVIGAKALEVAAMVCGAVGVLTGSWRLMLAMVFLMGSQSAIFNPALNGSIPELFPRHRVNPVNANLRIAATGAILFGVACAGLALNFGGGSIRGWPTGRLFVAAVVLGVALAGLVAALGVPHREAADPQAPFPWKGSWDTMKELWRIRLDPFLTLAIGMIVLVFFLGALKIMIVNEIGLDQYGLGEAATSGMIFAAMAGVGVGGLISNAVIRRCRWDLIMMPLALAIGVIFCIMALAPLFPAAAQVPLIFLMLGLAGIIGGLMVIPSQAFLQLRPRPERRGAVIAACNFAVFSGILISGPTGWGLLESLRLGRTLLWVFHFVGFPVNRRLMLMLSPSTSFLLLAFLSVSLVLFLTRRIRNRTPDNPIV